MSTETPNPRDRVRVSFEGDASEFDDHGRLARIIGSGVNGDWVSYIPESAVVEVLERADGPAVGEIRREEHDGGHSIWQVEEHEDGERYWRCTYSTAKGNRGVTFELGQMLDLPVTGAVPGTPAAEAQKPLSVKLTLPSPQVRVENAPGLSIPDRQRVADLLVSGDVVRAVRAAAAAGLTGEQAERYVRDMEEWQTYLNHHGGTEVDPTEADRMRAMGFDRQPEFKLTDEQRAEIREALWERQSEFHIPDGTGVRRLEFNPLAGVVADIVWAAIKQDRERGDQ